jgi:hypothetical protein
MQIESPLSELAREPHNLVSSLGQLVAVVECLLDARRLIPGTLTCSVGP